MHTKLKRGKGGGDGDDDAPPATVGGCLMRLMREKGGHVPDDWGTVASSGYGLMVVKTTDYAADAEQTALSGASRRPPKMSLCSLLLFGGKSICNILNSSNSSTVVQL